VKKPKNSPKQRIPTSQQEAKIRGELKKEINNSRKEARHQKSKSGKWVLQFIISGMGSSLTRNISQKNNNVRVYDAEKESTTPAHKEKSRGSMRSRVLTQYASTSAN